MAFSSSFIMGSSNADPLLCRSLSLERTRPAAVQLGSQVSRHLQFDGLTSRQLTNTILKLPLTKPTKRGTGMLFTVPRVTIRGSVYENVLPLNSTGNGVGASREKLSEAKPTLLTRRNHPVEEFIERVIFNCRFLTLMAVAGSLAGSLLCFFKGCLFVVESFIDVSWNGLGTGKVILLLVEAVDVYLMGTVMLIFGMGLYELFVSSIEVPGENPPPGDPETTVCGSNLFGLFRLRERPAWLEVRSLDELKTKLGHVIVMILLVGMFEKSKKVPVNTGLDLLCFSASILMASGCLFLLSKLNAVRW